MPLHHAIILAVLQGLTEFLPISSSAHLDLAPWLLGWPDQGLAFDVALHFGTLAAILIYFYRDWLQVIAQGFGFNYSPDPELRHNPRLLWLLAAASIPVAVVGVLFEKRVEHAWRENHILIGLMLVGVGILMWIADRLSSRRKGIGEVSGADALSVGLAQAVAIIPGTSRSGITITAGLFRNINRAAAARFSFLLSAPALGGAALKKLYDLMKAGGIPEDGRVPMAVGTAVAALTGCIVIAFFLRYLRSHSLKFFVLYRIVFGIIVIALAVFRHPAG